MTEPRDGQENAEFVADACKALEATMRRRTGGQVGVYVLIESGNEYYSASAGFASHQHMFAAVSTVCMGDRIAYLQDRRNKGH